MNGGSPRWAAVRHAPAVGAIVDEHGAIHCCCGNTPDWDGFDACHRDGRRDDDLLGMEGAALHYRCNRCDAIYGPWPAVTTVREGVCFG